MFVCGMGAQRRLCAFEVCQEAVWQRLCRRLADQADKSRRRKVVTSVRASSLLPCAGCPSGRLGPHISLATQRPARGAARLQPARQPLPGGVLSLISDLWHWLLAWCTLGCGCCTCTATAARWLDAACGLMCSSNRQLPWPDDFECGRCTPGWLLLVGGVHLAACCTAADSRPTHVRPC